MKRKDSTVDWTRALLLTAPLAILAGCNRHTGPPGPQGNPGPGAQIVPDTVLTLTNINPNDITAGPEGRALLILNVDSDELYNFPFTTIAGGPVYGQSQHTAIAPDKRTVYVTMGAITHFRSVCSSSTSTG